MSEKLLDPRRATAAAGVKPLQDKGAADRSLLDIKAVDIELVIVLGIGDRSLQHLLDLVGNSAVRKSEFGKRRGD